MREVWMPPVGSILFVRQRVTPGSISRGYQMIRHKSSVFLDECDFAHDTFIHESTYILEPGEWYIINGVTYTHGPKGYASLTLPLLRSKPDRQWVRERLDSIGEDIANQIREEFAGDLARLVVKTHSNDRNIYVSAMDLNGKACIANTREEAIRMRKDFISQTPSRLETQRFRSLLVD